MLHKCGPTLLFLIDCDEKLSMYLHNLTFTSMYKQLIVYYNDCCGKILLSPVCSMCYLPKVVEHISLNSHASDTGVLVVVDCVCFISIALLVLLATTHWGQEIHVLCALQAVAVHQPAVHPSLVP